MNRKLCYSYIKLHINLQFDIQIRLIFADNGNWLSLD